MASVESKQWVLKEKAGDNIDVNKTFELTTTTLTPTEDDDILVKMEYLSNDPSQRTWVSKNIAQDRHYMKLVELGQVMPAVAIGRIIHAGPAVSGYAKDDLVSFFGGWSQYMIIKPKAIYSKVDSSIPPDDFLALHITALTAYFGIYRIAQPKDTDKLFVVSAAAGSTGSVVAQIAKHVLGLRVVAIAGSDEKCKMLREELGVDVALNYKSENYEEEFEKATDGYIDIYWDNTGGKTLDMAVNRMKKNGRIVACGAIGGYNNMEGTAISMESYGKMITMRVRMEGFIISDYVSEYAEGRKALGKWLAQGKLKPLKTVWETPIEGVPEGMNKLLRGDNVGKFVTKIQ